MGSEGVVVADKHYFQIARQVLLYEREVIGEYKKGRTVEPLLEKGDRIGIVLHGQNNLAFHGQDGVAPAHMEWKIRRQRKERGRLGPQ